MITLNNDQIIYKILTYYVGQMKCSIQNICNLILLNPWRRKGQPIPVFLPGGSYGQRSLEGYGPWGRKGQTVLSTHTTLLNTAEVLAGGKQLYSVTRSYCLIRVCSAHAQWWWHDGKDTGRPPAWSKHSARKAWDQRRARPGTGLCDETAWVQGLPRRRV